MRKFTVKQGIDPQTYNPVCELSFDGVPLSIKWNLEVAQDAQANHGISFVEEMISIFKKEVKIAIPDITEEELAQLEAAIK